MKEVIGNLLDENGNFVSYQSFLGKYEIATNCLTYNGCVQAVKRYAKRIGMQFVNDNQSHENILMKIIHSVPKGARLYYDMLLNMEAEPNCCNKWAKS